MKLFNSPSSPALQTVQSVGQPSIPSSPHIPRKTLNDSIPDPASSGSDSPRIPRKKVNVTNSDPVAPALGSESVHVCGKITSRIEGSNASDMRRREPYQIEAGPSSRSRFAGMEHRERLQPRAGKRSTSNLERRDPRCIREGCVYIRPVLEELEQQRLFRFMEIYKSITADQRGDGVRANAIIFSEVQTDLERWRLSLLYEIAASLYKTKTEGLYLPLTSRLLSRNRVSEGAYVETISNCERSKLLPYDVVYHTSSDGIHITGLAMGAENDYDFSGVPVLVLDWFSDYEGSGEIFYVGNIRHEMARLLVLDGMANPTSQMAATLSAFITGDSQRKWDLFEDMRQKPLYGPEFVFRLSQKCSVSSKYITALCNRAVVNEQQGAILARALACCESWVSTRDSERSQLNRFLLVSGVPGCGKTYTAVYLIATFTLYFNPEFARNDAVPYWNGQVLILTKTNKALDVFLQRLGSVRMPSSRSTTSWSRREIPCFCKRSAYYMSREGYTELGRRQTDNVDKINDVPVILSTFGNLQNLCTQMTELLGGHIEAQHWVANYFKVAIIDEGSQSIILDLAYFVTLFPTFDGVIIIMGDKEQMGPVVLTNMKEAREFLSRSLFMQFIEIRSYTGFIVPHVEMVIQYRMHKDIMNLANDITYKGKMCYGHSRGYHDAKGIPREVHIPLKSRDHHSLVLGPVVAYTTSDAPFHTFRCRDYVNQDELEVARVIIPAALSLDKFDEEDIVFLSPYKQQCSAMRRLCSSERLGVGIHTVASFQGQEASLVIYSLVRRSGGGTGFLDCKELTSVAITRPRDRLVIIGDLSYFCEAIDTSSVWKDLLTSIRNRGTSILSAEGLLSLPSRAQQPI